MLGKRNSVVSRLKAKQPNLHVYVIHCVCHVSHAVLIASLNSMPPWSHTANQFKHAWREISKDEMLREQLKTRIAKSIPIFSKQCFKKC